MSESRAHGRVLVLLVGAMLSAAVASMTILRAQSTASGVKDIASYVTCINDNVPNGQPADVADTVDPCLPKGCTFTMTMSHLSAQAACTLGDCQLPRIILDCPDPTTDKNDLRFRPSFLMCPLNSQGDGVFGTDRVEVSEDVQRANGKVTEMKMAEVSIAPRQDFRGVHGVLSTKGGDKGCNVCHSTVARIPASAPAPTPVLSQPIDPFDYVNLIALAPFVIHTDDPQRQNKIKPARGLRRETIKEICDCIEKDINGQNKIKAQANAVAAGRLLATDQGARNSHGMVLTDNQVRARYLNPDFKPETLLKLCKKLQGYAATRAYGIAQPRDPPDLWR